MRSFLSTTFAVLVGVLLSSCGGGGGSGSGGTTQAGSPPSAAPPAAGQTCLADVPALSERSLVDRPDDKTGAQLHLVYAIPSDATDQALDIIGQIQAEMEVAQRWLQQQVGRCISMDTFQDALDVTFVQFSRTNEQIRTSPAFVDQSIRLELEARGLDDPNKVYVVYYGGSTNSGSCGGAAAIGGPAVQYLASQNATTGQLSPCSFFRFVSGSNDVFRGTWAGVAMHETFHSIGVVPQCAPDHDDRNPLHLDTISSDLMAFDGTGFSTYTLDANRSEYYAHNNVGCLDLEDSAAWEDAIAVADPLPARTAYQDAREIACADEPIARSSTGGDAVPSMRLVNVTAEPLSFYKLDENGARQNQSVLAEYSESFDAASVGEVYLVAELETDRCIGLFEVTENANRILVAD